jgi:hypothetical protein
MADGVLPVAAARAVIGMVAARSARRRPQERGMIEPAMPAPAATGSDRLRRNGMKRGQHATQFVLTAMVAVLLAFTALAQSADEIARVLQENFEDIELQIRVAPTEAEANLERQRDQLDALRSEAPDHPMLPSLEERLGQLDAEVAAARADQPAAVGDEQFVPLRAPAEARGQLRDVETLQTRADREMMSGRPDHAEEYLSEAESLIEAIEDEFGDQMPPGYAPLIVAKERLAALRDQLGRPQAD